MAIFAQHKTKNMRKTRLMFSALVTAMALFVALSSCGSGKSGGSGEQAELKLNFKPGDKYLYSTDVSQTINTMGMSGMQQKVVMDMIYEVTASEAENKKLSITYDHIQMKSTTPMGAMEYDSRSGKKGENMLSFMDSLIGKSFSITLAPDGSIVKVENLGEMMSALPGDAATKAELQKQFSDTAIRQMMQNSFDMYPGKPVKVGESWHKQSKMGVSGFNINMDNTYTLKSITNGKATVAVVSEMKLPATEMNQGGMQMKMEMTGKQDGNMEVDIATGQIISGKTHQVINGKINVGGQEMPMDIAGDIIISSKKL
ncbi:hypothetical protein B0I18_101550 [Taibaiella chishuiensis]|uniref:DUF4412 domain-containing protein n=2 Tax=Taibaiella chishuiensis TaxID=1434707 RepID=A0A2P8DB18_9BACT|nr:hypothetical protein B0I18_101550 [Taibaiella chishuiensis]